MSDTEFSEKIIKQISGLLKPSILVKNSGKFIFIAGVFCTGNLCLNYFLNRNLEKIIHQTYKNKKIDKINTRINKIKHSVKKIQSDNQNKNELLLSLLQIHDTLFSEIRYAVNQLHLMRNTVREITDKLKSIQNEKVLDNGSLMDNNSFAYLAEDNTNEKSDNSTINENSTLLRHIQVNDEGTSSDNCYGQTNTFSELDSPSSNSNESYGNYDILSFS